jgi:hypothetical protein
MESEETAPSNEPSGAVEGESESAVCSICGTRLSTTGELCPVCMLRSALSESPETIGSSSEQASAESEVQRFEHYELVKGQDGKPIELGRGAMGVTYKALDVDLRCPVALKVISSQYLNDESVRLRFLREARAAASLRHPNVASVFHLGRNRRGLLLCDGVCRGRNVGESY